MHFSIQTADASIEFSYEDEIEGTYMAYDVMDRLGFDLLVPIDSVSYKDVTPEESPILDTDFDDDILDGDFDEYYPDDVSAEAVEFQVGDVVKVVAIAGDSETVMDLMGEVVTVNDDIGAMNYWGEPRLTIDFRNDMDWTQEKTKGQDLFFVSQSALELVYRP